MGPEINNSFVSTNNNPTMERLGIVPGKKIANHGPNIKIIVCIILGIIAALIIMLSLLLSNSSNKAVGSKNKEDFISFLKIYQYGSSNVKKDVNTNIPAKYTYAYELLASSESDQNKISYGEKLYEAYRKYDNQKSFIDVLNVYRSFIGLEGNTNKLREYFTKSEDEARTFVSAQTSILQETEDESIKGPTELIKKYLEKYLDYLTLLKKTGCIQESGIVYDCEVAAINDYQEHEQVFDLNNELQGIKRQIDGYDEQIITSLNILSINTYKVRVNNGELKK